MPNTIRIKRRASGAPGAPAELAPAELAFNEVDNTLYYGKGVSGGNAQSILPIAGPGSFVNLSEAQTVSGTKTFSGPCAFTGTGSSSATGVTQSSSDDSTRLATTAYVKSVVSSAGGGSVTSVAFSGGTTGLTVTGSPITSSGTITLAGTLAVANGGTGITSFGTGVATFLGTPSSANLAAAVTDETGTGSLVFSASPTLTGTVSVENLTLSGNLTVNGTTTTINSTTVTIDDKNFVLGDVASPTDAGADGGGITLRGTTDKTLNWVDATDAWTSSEYMNLLTGNQIFTLFSNKTTVMRTCVRITRTINSVPTADVQNTGFTLSSASIPINQWNHYAATFDRTNLRIYVNGTQRSTLTLAAASNFTYTGNLSLSLGWIGFGNQSPGYGWNGDADDFRLYTSTLTAAEIAAIAAQ